MPSQYLLIFQLSLTKVGGKSEQQSHDETNLLFHFPTKMFRHTIIGKSLRFESLLMHTVQHSGRDLDFIFETSSLSSSLLSSTGESVQFQNPKLSPTQYMGANGPFFIRFFIDFLRIIQVCLPFSHFCSMWRTTYSLLGWMGRVVS